MRASVQPGSLAPCFDELVRAVDGWQRRVKLVWPYGEPRWRAGPAGVLPG